MSEPIIEDIPKGDSLPERWARAIYSFIIALCGCILLIAPGKGMALGGFFLGLWLIIEGGQILFHFVKSSPSLKDRNNIVKLIRSIVTLIVGILFILRPGNMSEMTFSFFFIVTGLLLLLQAFTLWLNGSGEPNLLIFLLGVIGLLLMVSPLFTTYWFLRITGLVILIRGVGGFFILLRR